mmetsp:Transcript_49276/g.104849  ORF Transcript_49276/g.104849 Transcript_49276/m.104849 type:complete len:166 (+) Transcript_49276:230-727(+)|eukprot:CAMPEP_0206419996 /NCGR_PEP_ID=MMETSP0324_2-20121206/532_1 /ASSEMBLY_ACC=CAM_ASM_000836 /TAXON_ID=2866 /ORGANISM="Crypthecodinium cohnii, Strain Seligo" /LENGTH=165 /DNA_ID=CAMNT_0053883701 /DNA_START=88 /DNA_END=585 /DNA_ORIENTATION=+
MGVVCCSQESCQGLCDDTSDLQGQQKMELIVVRVDRRTGKVGLDLDVSCYDVLPVVRVSDGPVADWNRLNPQARVGPGDAIVKVNDVEGDPEAMMERLRGDSDLKITVLRGAQQGNFKLTSVSSPDTVSSVMQPSRLTPRKPRPACASCLTGETPCEVPWLSKVS